MPFDAHKNFAYSTVATAPAPADSGTSLTLTAGGGALMPAVPFNATVWPTAAQPLSVNAEIVRVTNVAGDVLTFSRTAESGGINRSILVGDQFAATITNKTLTDVETVAAAALTTAMASNRGSDFVQATAAFAGTSASGTIASNGISVSIGPYITTAMLSNRGSDFVQATAVFNGTNASGTIASGALSVSVLAQSNQTAGLYASSNTYLTSSGTVDARSLSFRGDKSITIGVSAGEVVFSVGAYLTTAMASNRGSDFVAATAGFNGTNASGTLASNSWSVSVAAPIPIATAVKAVASIGSTGTITRYAPEDHQHAGVAAFAITNTGNTLGNTRSQVGTLFLAASGAITASQSTAAAGNDTLWLSVAAQSAVAGHALGVSNTGNTLGNTGSGSTGTVVFAASGAITASQSTGAGISTVWYSVAAQSNQSAIKGFGASNTGNTAGNTGISTGVDWVLAGSTNITVSESTTAGGPNTLWLSVPNQAAGNVTFSASANSSGLGSVIFANSNNITFGLTTGSQITASFGGGGGAAVGASTVGNTAGNTGTFSSGTVVFAGSNSLTISQATDANGATLHFQPAISSLTGVSGITLSTAGSTVSIYPALVSEYMPYAGDVIATNSTFGQSSICFAPFDVVWPISASRVNLFVSLTHTFSGAPANSTAWIAVGYGLYTRQTGLNNGQMSLLTSYSMSMLSGSVSSSTRLSLTYYSGLSNATSHSSTSYQQNNASVSDFIANSIAGYRVIALPVNLTLTPGRYWFGFSNQTASQGASFVLAMSVGQIVLSNYNAYRPVGTSSAAFNASFFLPLIGAGVYSAQTAGWPNTIALTTGDLRAAPGIPLFNFSGITYNTSLV